MGERGWQQLRIKAGRPAAGAELTADWTPLDAGLAGPVSLAKGCYVGQETLAKVHRLEATRHALWGLQLSGPVSPGTAIHAGLSTTVPPPPPPPPPPPLFPLAPQGAIHASLCMISCPPPPLSSDKGLCVFCKPIWQLAEAAVVSMLLDLTGPAPGLP